VKEQRFALILSEFQYLAETDPSVSSQIQAWWNTSGLRNQAYIVLCGSHTGMMKSLAGTNQPLYGRFTSRCKLQPMAYYNTALFYQKSNWSTRDKLIACGVLGETSKYHAVFSSDYDRNSDKR